MKKSHILFCLSFALSGAALAHTGVKNPAVMARMHTMSSIGTEMKTIGKMAKGEVAFDQTLARTAAAAISKHAAETPALFEANEDDPKSEALPAIWDDFADFTTKSEALEKIALGLADSITTEADVKAAVKSLGQACRDCHKLYRE